MTWAWYVLNSFIQYVSLWDEESRRCIAREALEPQTIWPNLFFLDTNDRFLAKSKKTSGMVTFWFAHIVKPPSDDFCDCNGIKIGHVGQNGQQMAENERKCLFGGKMSVFRPKILIWGDGVKVQGSKKATLMFWKHLTAPYGLFLRAHTHWRKYP